jgi:CheY-like chemotaxis protein
VRAGSVTANTAILVIDDDPTVRDLLLRYLAKEGYHVECVASGDEGLERARSILPMAIILDVMMPHKDGWAVLQEIKADPILLSTPVIMYTMVDEKNFGLAIGASEYLIKPVSRETILQVVDKYKHRVTSEHVLVVDDDADLRELASRVIEKAGWKVLTAENGESALTILKTVSPSIIFLDLMMPVMNGFEFLAAFQSHEEWRHIPVVVITSRDLSSEERLQLSSVAKKIIQKGDFTPEILLRQLSVLIPQLTHTEQSNTSGPHGQDTARRRQ